MKDLDFANNNFRLMKMTEISPNKLSSGNFVMSNFSFFHNVFERLVLQTFKKLRLVWERIKC